MANGSNQQWGLTALRVIVGIVFLIHGAQKLFVFGFHGVAGMLGGMGIPVPAVSAVILTPRMSAMPPRNSTSVVTRWAAALIAIDMMVAVLVVHLKNGFFNPKGFEYPLTLLAACIALILSGPGAASVDGAMAKRT